MKRETVRVPASSFTTCALGTVQKYLRLARYMTGTPFPLLPARLLGEPASSNSPSKAPRGYSSGKNLGILVGAAGIELAAGEGDLPGNVAERGEMGVANSPPATVGAKSGRSGAIPTSSAGTAGDIDDAIFAAFKVAKAAGDFERARALLDLLAPNAPILDPGKVTPLALVRGNDREA